MEAWIFKAPTPGLQVWLGCCWAVDVWGGQWRRMGYVQLEILRILWRSGGSAPYWSIVTGICGGRERPGDWVNDPCRASITKALRSLRRQGLIERREQDDTVAYTLTRKAVDWLRDFCTAPA